MNQKYNIILTLGLAIIGVATIIGLFGLMMEKLSTNFEKLANTVMSYFDQPLPQHVNYSDGQKIYVPAYSYLPVNKNESFNLNILLSIRNTDPSNKIYISRVDYYDTEGTLLKQFIQENQILNPLETREFFIEQTDPLGGSGANFFITWKSDSTSYEPVVEALMYGAQGPNNFSFKSKGLIIPDD